MRLRAFNWGTETKHNQQVLNIYQEEFTKTIIHTIYSLKFLPRYLSFWQYEVMPALKLVALDVWCVELPFFIKSW